VQRIQRVILRVEDEHAHPRADRARAERDVGRGQRVGQHELAAAHLRAAVDVVRLGDRLRVDPTVGQGLERLLDEVFFLEMRSGGAQQDASVAPDPFDRLDGDLRVLERAFDAVQRLLGDDQLVRPVPRLRRFGLRGLSWFHGGSTPLGWIP
jgi:hypothetical protein